MKIPKFKNESEEADWWYANRKKVERELRNAKPVTDASGKPMTPAEIAAGHIAAGTRVCQETLISYTVIYEHGPNEEGNETWSAYIPDLTGVVSCGDTRDECERMIREAIELYAETMRDLGRPLPAPSSEAGVVEIAVRRPQDK
jgi:predicted RNase H-like HicB family nuclease